MADKYDHTSIEKKWQKKWATENTYKTPDAAEGKENFYFLTEFPYPSGNLHVGHWYAFSVPDIFARYMRMRGYNVLYPIGFDAFGLPAENAAIKNKLNPRKWTFDNIDYMRKQLRSMGASFDWSREVVTADPAYYKWTQWLFLRFYKKGLVYRKETAVNWCPQDKTVLANEQVVDGRCERCGTEVVQRQMQQWSIKITDYADRLIDDLANLDWPKQIKDAQINWIGRSEGAEIDFALTNVVDENPDEARSYIMGQKNISEKDIEAIGGKVVSKTNKGFLCVSFQKSSSKAFEELIVAKMEAGFWNEYLTNEEVVFIFKHKNGNTERFVLNEETNPIISKLGNQFNNLQDTTESVWQWLANNAWYSPIIPRLKVFTTRPDTLFGATYMVLAPEHPLVAKFADADVQAYIDKANKKTEIERTGSKEKTGVKLVGVKAINPATKEEIPIYVADYVLGGYGTGAIMAVPAHDERDHAFAKKFDLPIRQVIEPLFVKKNDSDGVRAGEPLVERNAVVAIIKHPTEDKYLGLKWKKNDWQGFVVGGIENGEDVVVAAAREIHEETGYKNVRFVKKIGSKVHSQFYHEIKKQNRFAHFDALYFELDDDARDEMAEGEKALHEVVWLDKNKVAEFCSKDKDMEFIWQQFIFDHPYSGNGILINSNQFNGLNNEEAKKKITEFVRGRMATRYHLRDWVVSRQRFWGVPIPMIHCEKCGYNPVPENQLPVVLPDLEDYLPTGEGKSPLAKKRDWVEVPCPACGGTAERETDTLDTFVDSSWYFQRYADPRNDQGFASKEKLQAWLPVDIYSGGSEHTTMHVLYSRFWHKAMYDLGLVAQPEPYLRRLNRGLIMGPDGQKMSKSKGNVVDPDAVVAELGADTVRMYLAFIGPYNEVGAYPWNPQAAVGVRRFLEKIWKIIDVPRGTIGWHNLSEENEKKQEILLHRTIKKVSEDIMSLKLNTAVSELMKFVNQNGLQRNTWEDTLYMRAIFLTMLSAFAPHIAHELAERIGVDIHRWPVYDKGRLTEAAVVVAVQVNGKTRATVTLAADAAEAEAVAAASAAAEKWLAGPVQKVVYKPGKIINLLV